MDSPSTFRPLYIAGISQYYGAMATTPLDQFTDHYNVNFLGPVVLFQEAHQLLLESPSGAPVFALISSAAGSISSYAPMPAAA